LGNALLWLAAIVLAVASLIAGWRSAWPFWAMLVIVGITAVLAVFALWLLWPDSRPSSTAFVRGDVDQSSFDGVLVDGADTAFDGNVRRTAIRDFIFRSRR